MIDDITTVFKFHWGKYCMLEVRERYEELSTLLFHRLRVIIPNADGFFRPKTVSQITWGVARDTSALVINKGI
jgi:hypothetical protein